MPVIQAFYAYSSMKRLQCRDSLLFLLPCFQSCTESWEGARVVNQSLTVILQNICGIKRLKAIAAMFFLADRLQEQEREQGGHL